MGKHELKLVDLDNMVKECIKPKKYTMMVNQEVVEQLDYQPIICPVGSFYTVKAEDSVNVWRITRVFMVRDVVEDMWVIGYNADRMTHPSLDNL